MKGILALVFVCLIADFTDANVASWTETGFSVTTGGGTAIVNMKWGTKVVETSAVDAAIVTLTATGGTGHVYTFASTGNPSSVGAIKTSTSGAITLATGKSIDYETTKTLVFVVIATPTTGTAGTATVTVEIKNKVEFSRTHFILCVADGLTAGSTVGTYTVTDKATDDTVGYTLTSTDFAYGATTGVVTVKTGQTLAMATTGGYALDLTATVSAGSSDTAAVIAKLYIAVGGLQQQRPAGHRHVGHGDSVICDCFVPLSLVHLHPLDWSKGTNIVDIFFQSKSPNILIYKTPRLTN